MTCSSNNLRQRRAFLFLFFAVSRPVFLAVQFNPMRRFVLDFVVVGGQRGLLLYRSVGGEEQNV